MLIQVLALLYPLLTTSSVLTATASEERSDSLSRELLATRSINEIPIDQFLTLYNIHVETSQFVGSTKSFTQATVDALKGYSYELRRINWYKKSAFIAFYEKRIVKPCSMIRSICEAHCGLIDEISAREAEVFEVSHLGSIRPIARKCQSLREGRFRDSIHPLLIVELRKNNGSRYIQASLLPA